ncbi:MAG: cytochrome c [Gammaproteobacteria bacterium]|nr:cytochrome c [Gammaproteobacteria bacterium]MCW8986124.1 cytochrome c [Gammaproteobacteria bacterium]MCW9031900.1 cytochrome c [Gammaproteobacteria bacterium]
MREKWARLIALFTGLIVLLLAMVFALIQNPHTTSKAQKNEQQISSDIVKKSVNPDSIQIEEGRKIYQEQNCSACHSIAGKGNPRTPLDGVGTRRTAEELRNWIIGSDSLQGLLPDSIRRLKQRYKELSDNELDALVNYLNN